MSPRVFRWLLDESQRRELENEGYVEVARHPWHGTPLFENQARTEHREVMPYGPNDREQTRVDGGRSEVSSSPSSPGLAVHSRDTAKGDV